MKITMRKASKIIIASVGFPALVIILYIAFLGISGNFGRPIRYEITAPYQGWVTVTYAKPGCPFLPYEGFFMVVRIDQSGNACTNTPMPQGMQYAQYFYIDANGKKTKIPSASWGHKNMIQAWSIASHIPEKVDPFFTEELYIGTEEELNKSWSQEPGIPSNRCKVIRCY